MSLRKIFIVLCLIVAFVFALELAASADEIRVFDKDEMLSAEDEARITEAALSAESEYGCRFYIVTHAADRRSQRYLGEDFIRERGFSFNDDIVLLIITLDTYENTYYYNMYYYGMPSRRISDMEVESILDNARVYNNLKTGRLAEGSIAFIELSGEATKMPWAMIIVIAVIAAVIVGGITVYVITSKYKMKMNPTNYPLDKYAKLKLTGSNEKFIDKHVAVILTSSGGGPGGRPGGGGGYGGGRGHAGGR